MKSVLKIIGILIVLLLGLILFNTLRLTSKQLKYQIVQLPEPPKNAVSNFSKSIRYKTISYNDSSKVEYAEFEKFHEFLANTYPLTDSLLIKQLINSYTLLFEWSGSDSELKPILYLAHQDVVPVDSGSISKWEQDPFSGAISDNKVYGRGTLDDKCGIIGMLEAVEMLLNEGFQPKRTIYLAFGHDEELGGKNGAGEVAKFFEKAGINFYFTLDEGFPLLERIIPEINKPVALIGTAEKGFVSFELKLETEGGHSSSPGEENTIGIMASAITKLEQNQFQYQVVPPVDQQIRYLGGEMPFLTKMVFANTWLFSGPLLRSLNAHTTTVPTIFQSGVKDNVIPTTAQAVVNFRIMPGETIEMIRNHIIETIDDERISVKIFSDFNEPSKVSPIDNDAFGLLNKTIKQVFGDVIVAPGLVPGGTDTKHFSNLSDLSYRFNPIRFTPENRNGFHGLNEFAYVDSFEKSILFYYQLLKNLNDN